MGTSLPTLRLTGPWDGPRPGCPRTWARREAGSLRPRGPGALYLGNDLETCARAVAHHHALHCKASQGAPAGLRAVLTHLRFQVDGTFADAAGARTGGLHDPEAYAPSWTFGTRAKRADLQGVHYRSVHRKGGRCLAVFAEGAAAFLGAEPGAVVLEWDGTHSRRIA